MLSCWSLTRSKIKDKTQVSWTFCVPTWVMTTASWHVQILPPLSSSDQQQHFLHQNKLHKWPAIRKDLIYSKKTFTITKHDLLWMCSGLKRFCILCNNYITLAITIHCSSSSVLKAPVGAQGRYIAQNYFYVLFCYWSRPVLMCSWKC